MRAALARLYWRMTELTLGAVLGLLLVGAFLLGAWLL